MDILSKIQDSTEKYSENNAFFINNVFYTYFDLAVMISKIRKSIQLSIDDTEQIIGLITNDDLETYSSIIALWLEGKAYVPISYNSPIDRNENIILQSDIKTVLDSSQEFISCKLQIINTKNLLETTIDLAPKKILKSNLAYLLFTSGTTGIPKGVPISRSNLSGIINALDSLNFNIDENDRCLQMSELTFDVSITSFVYPLIKGACVYTVPSGVVKFTYVYELLENQKLTVAQLVPSLLNYLQKYFDEIYLPHVKYTFLTAEALPVKLAEEWSKCVPNSKIFNFYGPTENTVWSSYYEFNRNSFNLSYNGLLSIGKALNETDIIIIDKNNQILSYGNKGELCLSGTQLTSNYWKNDKKNSEAFFYLDYKNKKTKFYRTGDLCSFDVSGNIIYLGRIDFQTKINGYRVELCEIEHHAKSFLEKINVIAIEFTGKNKNSEIGIAIESTKFDYRSLLEYLKIKMPNYMIPSKLIFLEKFPLNSNQKIDRKEIKSLF